jgi:hypothetical protein
MTPIRTALELRTWKPHANVHSRHVLVVRPCTRTKAYGTTYGGDASDWRHGGASSTTLSGKSGLKENVQRGGPTRDAFPLFRLFFHSTPYTLPSFFFQVAVLVIKKRGSLPTDLVAFRSLPSIFCFLVSRRGMCFLVALGVEANPPWVFPFPAMPGSQC